MKINRNNYEPYFIDYLEGNLDESLVDDFIEFLTSNPDLKEELTLFEPVSVIPGEAVFSKKELLFKEKYDLENEFNLAAVANFEGDLAPEEKNAFEKYIASHPEKSKDAALFAKTKLAPDESVVFSHKNRLYKKPASRTLYLWGSRVAAVLVLALAVFWLIGQNENTNPINSNIASVEQIQPKIKTEEIKVTNPGAQLQANKVIKEKHIGKIKRTTDLKDDVQETEVLSNNQEVKIITEEPVFERNDEEIPAPVQPLLASVHPHQPYVSLKTMSITIPDNSFEDHLLVERVIEKTGLEKLSLNKIAKAGLNLVSSISNEKFSYQTDKQGNIKAINYDSRLLAFTIPTKTGEKSGE